MELKSKKEEKVTVVTHAIALDDGLAVIYKEYLNDKGCVIDCELRDENGNSLDGYGHDTAAILEVIQKFLDDTEAA